MRTFLAVICTILATNAIAKPIKLKCSSITEGMESERIYQVDLINKVIFREVSDIPSMPISISDNYISWEYRESSINLANFNVLERSSLQLITAFVTGFSFTPNELPDSTQRLWGPIVVMYQCIREI